MARLTKEEKEERKDRIAEFETKSKKLRTKMLQKRG